ncbi:hypothetical protein [Nocardiopsis ansamitocini]|uniref:Uncharacterized protein n=1 Tax=Nocardiopsis ansamitocini TaxID=1670832 RepID=A0A9W6P4A7_9ACTN|nr:hypothetical protein [Nocardiopsis ansamitocini]GLU47065.1 hypothetical protein Nans01_14160 [Nocardiopsis ansamitocini]
MNRKTLARIAFAAITVPALAFGAPAMAMADSSYHEQTTAAGAQGAYSHSVHSQAGNRGHDGDGYYYNSGYRHHGGWYHRSGWHHNHGWHHGGWNHNSGWHHGGGHGWHHR